MQQFIPIFFVVLILFFGSPLVAQEATKPQQEDNSWMLWKTGGRHRWLMYHLDKADVEVLKTKWAQIERSLANKPAEYSGYYIVPAHMSGYFLIWSEDAGYAFVRFFDVEHPCYFSIGDVVVEGPKVRFIQTGESNRLSCPSGNTGQPEEQWTAALGGQYFVPVSELAQFADYYGGFGEFTGYYRKFENHPAFPLNPNFKSEQDVKFVFPEEFIKFVKHPLTGEITYVGKPGRRKATIFDFSDNRQESSTPVRINIGRQHGLKKGQEFTLLTGDPGTGETLVVTKVGKKGSEAVVVRKLDKDGNATFDEHNSQSGKFEQKPFTPLRPGIKITTSPLSKLW